EAVDGGDAGLVPALLAAIWVLLADAAGDLGIDAAGRSMAQAAGLVAAAGVAAAAAEAADLEGAELVPGARAAVRIVGADALAHRGLDAAGLAVGVAAGAGAPAGAAAERVDL